MVAACSGSDLSDIVILADVPKEAVSGGDKVEVGLHVWTIHENLTSMRLDCFDPENGLVPVVDCKNMSVKRLDTTVVWQSPYLSTDSVKVNLKVQATDNQGHSATNSFPVMIVLADKPLAEVSGLTVYSSGFKSYYAFNLDRKELIEGIPADESKMDIFIDSDGTWRTKTNVRFSKVAGFDYAHVTRRGLDASIRSMQRYETVSSVQQEDVILVSRWTAATETSAERLDPWGAFKVIAVFPEEGYTRYIVNYKAL